MESDHDLRRHQSLLNTQIRSPSSYLLSTPVTSSANDSISTDQIAATTATSTSPSTVTSNTTGKSTYTLGKEIEIELGRGVSEEDTLLARSDKNAIDFAFDYSKLWCKTCKDLVLTLEKRAAAENDCTRAIMKQFQILESSTNSMNGAPFKRQTISLSRTMIDHCKEIEANNSKRCRELLEVLTRQRTLFDKTRKFLKDKWKGDVKRMLDAENSLFKTKSAYYQRCQAGVKLREELASAQNFLNELSASLNQTPSNSFSGAPPSASSLTTTPTSASGTAGSTGGSTHLSNSNLTVGSNANLAQDSNDPSSGDSSTFTASSSSSSSNQVAKQRAKVERLEKQLSDNDKKEIELMYAYREAVDIANHRLCELEKSKVEILCDTRLTITKSDEVVKDSLAELWNHLFTSRLAMIKQYETIANAYQDYVPCSDYRALVEAHVQKATEFVPEKYHFDGFHESKLDAGRIASRLGKDSGDSVGDSFSHRNLLSLHSDSDSDTETVDVVSNVVGRSSTSTGGGGGSSTTGASSSAGSSGVAGGIVSTSSNVLSTIVEFGSNLFRPDLKKSIRGKRSVTASSNLASGGANTADSLEAIAAQEANLEREYIAACYPVARCIAAIEKQANGLATHGIYRVPASKAKVSSLMDLLQSSQPNSSEQINKDIDVLCQEHPLTLASLVKTQLIALPEPLLTYNLYPNFVELGKAFDLVDSNVSDELMKRLQLLINHLSPGNRQLAGLIFHHLHRVAECQTENQMGAANLGTMFAPTVLRQRPKFQVANMMEFMDNKGQTKVVELLIDRVFHVFGSSEQYDPIKLIISHITSDTDKAVIADYNRMQTARGSISLAGCERSKSTSGTVSDELSEMGGSLINKTELKTTTSASIPTTTFSITGTSSGNIPSNNNNKGNGSTPSSSGLLRSATISVSSHTRAAGTLLSGALPLYTPFRSNQPSSKETEESSNTVNTNATTTSVYPEDKVITSRIDTIHGKQNPSTSEKLINVRSGVRLQDLAKTTGDPSSNVTSHTSSVVTSGTSGGSESSSIVRGIKRLYSTGNQHCTSSTISMTPNASSKLFSSSDKQHPSTLKSTASNSSSSSADSHTNTTLSSLVIGRRKPLGRLLTVHQSTEASSDSATTPNPLDLDQYSFIDNDLSDSPNG